MNGLPEDVEKRETEREIENDVNANSYGNRTDGGPKLIVWLAKRPTQYAFKIVYEQLNDSMNMMFHPRMIPCRA